MDDQTPHIPAARRSIRPRRLKARDPFMNHTLDADLEYIHQYAKEFARIDEITRLALQKYIFEGRSLEYYHGYYMAIYQAFTIAAISQSELTPTCQMLLFAICDKIVRVIEDAKKEINTAPPEFDKIVPS